MLLCFGSNQRYRLKRGSSRYLFSQMQAKFASLPFTLRAIEDATQAKAGIIECLKAEMVTPYPVLVERPGALVGHAKLTLLLMPSGTLKVTGEGFPEVPFVSENKPSEATLKILALQCGKKKKKGGKKKNKNKPAAAAALEGAAAEGGGGAAAAAAAAQ